jgi:hypothetical protein
LSSLALVCCSTSARAQCTEACPCSSSHICRPKQGSVRGPHGT